MNVAMIGASSAIAQEVAKLYAAEGASFFLAARDGRKLDAVANDLRTRGAANVSKFLADLGDLATHESIVDAAGATDIVLVAHGSLPDQLQIDRDGAAQVESFQLNATSVISIVARFAVVLETQRSGTIAVVGSVAGDRGRRSNYVYGAAKAATHAYCEGLRARLAVSNVSLLLVKPGWVDTPMTADMKKNPLYASPESVARGIHAAIRHRKATVYLPWFWRWISLIVRLLPARFVRF